MRFPLLTLSIVITGAICLPMILLPHTGGWNLRQLSGLKQCFPKSHLRKPRLLLTSLKPATHSRLEVVSVMLAYFYIKKEPYSIQFD